MKKVQWIIAVGVVLYVLGDLALIFIPIIFDNFVEDPELTRRMISWRILPTAVIGMIVNFGIAIWMFRLAKPVKEASRWVWALFGLVGGLMAPLLFYAIRIHNQLKERSGQEVEV